MIVFEVYRCAIGLRSRVSEHITDSQRLFDQANEDLRDDIAMRLYLVPGMNARVVDILGATLECQPEVFGAHHNRLLQCRKYECKLNLQKVNRGCETCGAELHRPMQAVSPMIPTPMVYFSFPFRRPAPYDTKATSASQFEPHSLLIERISGTFREQSNQEQHIGRPSISQSDMHVSVLHSSADQCLSTPTLELHRILSMVSKSPSNIFRRTATVRSSTRKRCRL